MITLKVKQITDDGRSKVWKISKHESCLTFGTSRKAKVVSIDQKTSPFEAVFELRNNQWHYISFNIINLEPDRVISNNTVIDLAGSKLYLEATTKEEFVVNQLVNMKTEGTVGPKLVMVTKNNQLIKTQLLGAQDNFLFYTNGKIENLNLPASAQWQSLDVNGFVINSKQIAAQDLTKLTDFNSEQLIDSDNKKGVLVTLVLTSLIIGLALIVPRSPTNLPVTEIKTSGSNIIVKNEFKKKPAAKNLTKSMASPSNEAPSGSGGGKTAAILKGAIGARISQLLGKVSATESRTANVLVTANGIKAGEASSGRALSALGKVESSGRNWNGESTGNGSGVSTAGIGGGKGSQGLGGGLGQGKTGTGGVGLIEEESEVIGGLDREVIAQYIKTQLGQILYCYERQLSASPELYGKIAVKFTIAGSGLVETQSINDTTLKNRSVESCILNKVAKWKFPEPKGGTKVVVTYPFLFKSTN